MVRSDRKQVATLYELEKSPDQLPQTLLSYCQKWSRKPTPRAIGVQYNFQFSEFLSIDLI